MCGKREFFSDLDESFREKVKLGYNSSMNVMGKGTVRILINAHVHIPNCKRSKFDDKSNKCVFLGVSEESKAYKLYDPFSQKIIVSRDVVFEEDKSWDWDKSHTEAILVDLNWDDNEKELDRHYDEAKTITNDDNEERETDGLNEECSSNSSESENLSPEHLDEQTR
ncbi:hypothetical protein CR513_11543, partial [Mucuna pruriens]